MRSAFANPIAAPPPAPTAAAAASDDTTASLPAAEPLAGPIPLPRHRPSVFAFADAGVPLPRARPGSSPEIAPAPSESASGYDAGMSHY
jgi:hypothetical protein